MVPFLLKTYPVGLSISIRFGVN